MGKPLVKLFVNKGHFYLYDAYKNKVLSLSHQAFNEINNHIRLSNYTSDTIISLKRKGYLKESDIIKLEHPFTPYVEKLVDTHVSSLILQVTQNCNFSCRYCTFASNNNGGRTHSKKTMTFDIARKSIDFLSQHSCDCPEVSISFYGGEPLLNFSLIKKCVAYAEKTIYNKPIKYYMTSNLYLATEQILGFLAEKNFNLLISLDGPKNIQNKHRRLASNGEGTYNKVLENVLLLKNEFPEYYHTQVEFNPVIYYDENPAEIVDFFANVLEIPHNRIHLQRVNTSGINISFDPLEVNHKDGVSFFDFQNDSDYNEIINDKNYISTCYHINGSCVPGADKLFVNVDGGFFPCEKTNECNKNMQIGSLHTGFNYDKIKYLMNMGYINEDNCMNCWAIRFCNRCCVQCDDGESNLSRKMMLDLCQTTKNNVLSFLKRFAEAYD